MLILPVFSAGVFFVIFVAFFFLFFSSTVGFSLVFVTADVFLCWCLFSAGVYSLVFFNVDIFSSLVFFRLVFDLCCCFSLVFFTAGDFLSPQTPEPPALPSVPFRLSRGTKL